MCLHTIILDPSNPARIFIAISAAGAFRTDDGGETWRPINRGLRSEFIPDPTAEVGHCVHRLAMHRSRPNVLYMQKHWDVMRTNDAVVTSFVESLMRDAGIRILVADQNMSILDGSLGILPRRILVDEDDAAQARRILADAGIAHEIRGQ